VGSTFQTIVELNFTRISYISSAQINL